MSAGRGASGGRDKTAHSRRVHRTSTAGWPHSLRAAGRPGRLSVSRSGRATRVRFTPALATTSRPGETAPTARFSVWVNSNRLTSFCSRSKSRIPSRCTVAAAPVVAPLTSPETLIRASPALADSSLQVTAPFSTDSTPVNSGNDQSAAFQVSPNSTVDSGSNASAARLSQGMRTGPARHT